MRCNLPYLLQMEHNEVEGFFASPEMQLFFLKLHEKDRKIKERINALELKNEDLELETFKMRQQNKLLSDKVSTTSSTNRSANTLEEKNASLHDSVELAEIEIKRLKSVVNEKEERLIAKKAWIDSLESVNVTLRREVEALQYRIKKQSETLARLTADKQTMETEILFERAETIQKENAALARIEELEAQLVEVREMLLSEKKIVHQKDQDYEDNLAVANCRAHELSAKLNEAERKIQELKEQEACSLIVRDNERKQLWNLLQAVKPIKENLFDLERDVQIFFTEYGHHSSKLKAGIPEEDIANRPRVGPLKVEGIVLKTQHPGLSTDDEENYILSKPLIFANDNMAAHELHELYLSAAKEKIKGEDKGQGIRKSVKKAARKWFHSSASVRRKKKEQPVSCFVTKS